MKTQKYRIELIGNLEEVQNSITGKTRRSTALN